MAVVRQYWKFFLVDTPTGQAYYLDANGLVQKKAIIPDAPDLALPEAPAGWEDMQLSFGRSAKYWGINRAFSTQFKFVRTGAKIIRRLLYGGSIETPISIIIFKWDRTLGYFRLYYKGQVDLSKIDDGVAEGVQVQTLEGGVVQLLKAYENTMVEIPCNGSIQENIKINADGILFNDVFHYQIINFTPPDPGVVVLPCVFLSNDGDNIGITKGNPIYEAPAGTAWYQQSANYLFSSVIPTTVRLTGSIVVKSDPAIANTGFYMYTATSLSQPAGVGGLTHATGLVTPFVPTTSAWQPHNSQTNVNGQFSFSFDATISLAANENLFLLIFNNFSAHPITILGGSFSMAFASRFAGSRVWGITDYDLFRKIFESINALASTTTQPFNYQVTSSLLQSKLNLVNTSGDAVRASTDPNYFQYFNQATLNPANPNNQDYSQFSTLGPVIKTSLSDFFDSYNTYLNAALSNQTNPDGTETVFLEAKKYVFNPTMDPSNGLMILPSPVTDLRISVATAYYWNWLKIGYNPQQYDEKAGKYEYNSLFQWQAPIKTLAKMLSLISPYRADSFGFEYTRWNTQGGKSTTFNNSDNSVFTLNVDRTITAFDYFRAFFISGVPLASSSSNTDQKLIVNQNYQPVLSTATDGEYFTTGQDFSIFIFNQPTPGSKTVAISFTALVNGLIGDSATIQLFINGAVVRTWSQAVSGINTAFNATEPTFSRTFNKGDNIYFQVTTVKTCTVSITAFTLNVGSGYFICQNTGSVDIPATSSAQLIPLPLITPTFVVIGGANIPVVSSGFQYFRFLSPVHNTNFNWAFGISGYVQGGGGNTATFDVWKNGANIGTVTYNATSAITQFNAPDANGIPPATSSGNFDFNLYDILWITGSCTNMSAWISNVQLLFTSTSILSYAFNRPNVTGKSDNSAYSNISGIPNPQTAFNIPDLTPGAILRANGSLLKTTLFNLPAGQLAFQTADKNQYLSTTLNEKTLQENAAIDIHSLDDPLFYPFLFTFKTEVPINFADLMNGAANAHVQFTYKNKLFYGFPIQVTSKPSFNESQEWQLLCSPATTLSDLYDLEWDGIPILPPMDAYIPYICPVHFVPYNYNKGSQYGTYTMDEDWYKNRVVHWTDSEDYFSPWNNSDVIRLQCQTNGLSPVQVQVMQLINGIGTNVGSPIVLSSVADPAVPVGQTLYQGTVPLTGLAEGVYYLLWTMGTGPGTASFISEGLHVKAAWDNTILFQYMSSFNDLSAIFSSGYNPTKRIGGRIGRFTPKSKFTTYVNQPQDISLLNAIPYQTWKLEIGYDSGVPDYEQNLMEYIMSCDTIFIEANQYSRDADEQFEYKIIDGEPKAYMTMNIRRAKNTDGVGVNTLGQLPTDMDAGYTIDAAAFGQNTAGQNLIQVTNS